MRGLFTQIPKQKGVPPLPETTVIPPPPPRLKQSGENDSQEEKRQIFIKPEEFERLLQEWLEAEPEGFEVDEDKLEELEEYITYRRKLRELTSQMVEAELERYIVKEEGLTTGIIEYVNVLCNDIEIENTEWRWYKFIGGDYCITNILFFKRIMAALGNPLISYAFCGREDVYIDCQQYILDKGGTFQCIEDEEPICEITLNKKRS